MGYEPKTFPKSMENYVSVQVGCLRILDSYRFLPSSLDNLLKSLDIMDSTSFKIELILKKLAYPIEYLYLDNFQEPLILTKEDFWSTLKQETPPDEENRTEELLNLFFLT